MQNTTLGVLALLPLLLGVGHGAGGATYCVAPKGSDAGPGTEAQPWQTLAKAAASVQPGDTVRIRAGDYFVQTGWNVFRAGTAAEPITYQAYGDGEVRRPRWRGTLRLTGRLSWVPR